MAPQQPGSCRDCLAWGVIRKHKWLCWGCRTWRQQFTREACAVCRVQVAVNPDGVCRLCWRQAVNLKWTKTGISMIEANRNGQQLFLANLHQTSLRDRGRPRTPMRHAVPATARAVDRRPVTHRQLVLFNVQRDLVAGQRAGFPDPPDLGLAAFLIAKTNQHATRHGWGRSPTIRARQAIRVLLALQDTPGAPVAASEVEQLVTVDLPVRPTLAVLASVGFLHDDRIPAIDRWFARQVATLPDAMAQELRVWFEVQRHGSTTAPRSRPRAEVTIRSRIKWVLPALRTWAGQGRQSLREITHADVLAVLPGSGNPRVTMGAGLRSLFTTLKARRLIFTNPIASIRTGKAEQTQPLPANLSQIREALQSTNPTRAAVAALIAFHGLRAEHLRHLRLTDVRDGRLFLPERTVLLAEPVRIRLGGYLAFRATRWPNTANSHLFINLSTAGTTRHFGPQWPWKLLGFSPRLIWEDRILDEAHATGGDIRRLCDLFGLTVAGALRYTSTIEHPDLSGPNTSSRTQASD